MVVRWPWHTTDIKKNKLISRYYKRFAKKPQTIHLRVWWLTFHMRKFPGARLLPTGLVDPASDITDLRDQGGRNPHPSAVSGWASPKLTWTRTPRRNSCGGAQNCEHSWGVTILSPILWVPRHPPSHAGHSQHVQASPHCKIIPGPANGTTVTCDLQVAAQSRLFLLVHIAMHVSGQ